MKARAFFSQLGGKLGVGLCLAGFLFLFLGWNGAAIVDRVASQFPYLISGGLVGLSFIVIGVGMIVVQNQRADRASLQSSIKELQRALEVASGQATDDVLGEFEMPPARPTPQHVVDTIAAGGSGAVDSASRQPRIEVVDESDAEGGGVDETAVIAPEVDDEQELVTRPARRTERAAPKKAAAKKAGARRPRRQLTADDA